MPAWAARLLALRRTVASDPAGPIADAIGELHAAGTAVVGDVTNTLAAYDPLGDSILAGAVFRELTGFSHSRPEQLVADAQAELARVKSVDRLRPSIVPHAPYSVSAELFRAIARAAGERPISVHLAESVEEIRFLQDGTGAWRDLLRELGVWRDSWQAPSCGPVEYLERLGLLNGRLLAVHGTQLTDGELKRLAFAGSTLVTCPRSNQRTGAGIPPIARFYDSGVRVAIGTDSLASVANLNLFTELLELRRLAPGVPAARLLRSATIEGATALGFAGEYGTIEAGKQAALVAVRIPADVGDVEEYLVGGIEPEDIMWLDAH
jgi:5-methylthioadenosine/S-adenosylhomocysteine deaminase